VNIGEPWPDSDAAWFRVLEMQTKLHQWATDDPKRRFDDLYNLVFDPAFLVVAWERVRGNRGAKRSLSSVLRPVVRISSECRW
jgi:RNA-directed DNA polymerase